jgi:hypothetical protein
MEDLVMYSEDSPNSENPATDTSRERLLKITLEKLEYGYFPIMARIQIDWYLKK